MKIPRSTAAYGTISGVRSAVTSVEWQYHGGLVLYQYPLAPGPGPGLIIVRVLYAQYQEARGVSLFLGSINWTRLD